MLKGQCFCLVCIKFMEIKCFELQKGGKKFQCSKVPGFQGSKFQIPNSKFQSSKFQIPDSKFLIYDRRLPTADR